MRLLPLFALWVQLAAAATKVVIPHPNGPYKVGFESRELVDHSRRDPYNASTPRRMMISRFDPQTPAQCKKTIRVPYFDRVLADAEAEIGFAFSGFPKEFFTDYQFQLEVCSTSQKLSRKYPVALFSPGLNTTRLFYSSLAQWIASQGITVITMDHPYDSDLVEFPNGDIIYGGRVDPPRQWPNGSDASVRKALEVRAADASFVLDTYGVEDKAVMFGQSFGGAAAATGVHNDKRIVGGVNIDGAMFGPVVGDGFGRHNRSFLIWSSDVKDSPLYETLDFFWASLGRDNSTWRREMTATNFTHGSTFDLNILVDAANYRDKLTPDGLATVGSVPGPHVYAVLRRFLPSYFRFALGLEPLDSIFVHGSKEFPGVRIVR